MKKLFLIVITIPINLCYGQLYEVQNLLKKEVNNSVFLEMFGNNVAVLFPSLNYERFILSKSRIIVSGRIGGVAYNQKTSLIFLTTLFNGLYRLNENLLIETGVGSVWISENKSPFKPNFTGQLGIRYQKKQKGCILRGNWTPFYDTSIEYFVFFFVGGSIGYAF